MVIHSTDNHSHDYIYEKNMFLYDAIQLVKSNKSNLEKELKSSNQKAKVKFQKNKENLKRLIDEINNHVPEKNN